MVFRDFGGNDHRLRPFTVEVEGPPPAYGQRKKKKFISRKSLLQKPPNKNKNKTESFHLFHLVNQNQINNYLIPTHK